MSRFTPFEARGGIPQEFYRFVQGATTLAEWTSGSVRRFGFVDTFRPVPLRREVIEANDERGGTGLRITIPADDARTNVIADLYRGTVPSAVVELYIYRNHQGVAARATSFFGEVVGAEFSGSQCSLIVESKQGAFKQRILRQLYQAPCNHTLYDTFCGVVQANFSAAATVTAIATDNITLTVPVASSQVDGYYTGGQLLFGSRRGFIIAHVGSTLTLMRPVPGLIVSASVTISAGCDRSIATCETKFNNVANHMGFPLIPSLNPFTDGVGGTTP